MLRIGLTAAVALWTVAPACAQAAPVQSADEPMPFPEFTGGGYFYGFVQAATPTSLTIAGGGHLMRGGRLFKGIHQFGLSDTLQRGDYEPDARTNLAYRLRDVRTGDLIYVNFGKWDGKVLVTHIRIERRPGGSVPPSPAQDPKAEFQYHEHQNAMQGWEERGAPIPDKYHPGGNQAGIAPMPRLAPPRPIN